ncbi:unnamed protein product, partial [Allacma fusca]
TEQISISTTVDPVQETPKQDVPSSQGDHPASASSCQGPVSSVPALSPTGRIPYHPQFTQSHSKHPQRRIIQADPNLSNVSDALFSDSEDGDEAPYQPKIQGVT